MPLRRTLLVRCAVAALAAARAPLARGADEPRRKPDLGDAAEGTYDGDVTSDTKGAPRSGVTLSVTRVGKDLVRVTSADPRLNVAEVPLIAAMGEVMQARGDTMFVLDRSQVPARLDVSIRNEIAWSGRRR